MYIINHLHNFLSLVFSSSLPPTWASVVAGVLVAISVSLSLYLVFEHLSAYKNPEEQKFLIGVILMVPCYGIESYISLMNPSISVDCEILRDGYEAFAMYCFVRYLVACLGGEERTVEFMEREGFSSATEPLLQNVSGRGIVKHPFPFNFFLKPWKLGKEFYQLIKIGIVQYVCLLLVQKWSSASFANIMISKLEFFVIDKCIFNPKIRFSSCVWVQMLIKTFTAILAVILEAFGVYCEGEFNVGCGYPYMAVVLNFSQTWALYCLIQFYTVISDELAHIKPLAKFLVFKSIVFLTWWQGVAIAIFSAMGLFKSAIAQDLHFTSSFQDFIICIEMSFASIVHLYVFPSKPYELMGDRITGGVSVLGDYASVDCPLDPDEVRDSERPTKLRLPQPDVDSKSGMTIRESVRDVVLGGGEYIVEDVKFTVNQAVEPMEKGFSRFNKKLHKISQNIKKNERDRKRTKDDSCIGPSSPTTRVIRGIDDPLLYGSFSDSGARRGRRHRRKSGYTSAESGGESSDQGLGGKYEVRGQRWTTKD